MKDNREQSPLKRWTIILAILAGVLLVTTIYFAFLGKPATNRNYIQITEEKSSLENELNALLQEHNKIKQEYGELSQLLSEKDSTILANADEIKKLINSQADYNKIKKQLVRLQNIAKEYVQEIDKLYQENQALKEENAQVKETLSKTKDKVATIEKDKESLNKKISEAAVYQVYNISAKSVSVKKDGEEKEVAKSRQVDRFNVSFVLAENSLIEPGPVSVYCRIAIPESGRILVPGAGNAYSFTYQGETLQYTVKKTINYTNKAENIKLSWDIRPDDKVVKGTYSVTIYTDNQLLGESFIVIN